MWYDKIILLFKNRELRNKFLIVVSLFIVFRIAANIPIPGIGAENIRRFFEQNQVFGLLNIFSGGALSNFSIAMLGLGPYITATIIMQLLTMIFPPLEKLYKEEGEQGRQKFNQYSRIMTVPLGMLQAYAMLNLFQRQGAIGELSPMTTLVSIVSVAAGCVLLMWLGELITERGIGNGVSLLIFAGIVAVVPENILQIVAKWDPAQLPAYLLFFAMALLIIAGVVMVNEGRRNIPVSYAKRVRGARMYGGVSTYLPLNINPAGVIPIIFALSIMLFPGMIANFLSGAGGVVGNLAQTVGDLFQNQWVYGILYFVLVFIFTYFYTAVTFNPK